MHPGLEWYLSLSAVLFVIGLTGVLTRRNVLVIFMCVEMMLKAVNISFIASGRVHYHDSPRPGRSEDAGPLAGDHRCRHLVHLRGSDLFSGTWPEIR
jgi:multisubunit Na+/H+ antiporter MnhC subunit